MFVIGFASGVYWATHGWRRSRWAVGDVGVGYSSLSLHRNDVGWFDGRIRVRNANDVGTTVLVTVHVYDKQENVADLISQVTLKAHSESGVDLRSTDAYRNYTDTTVELLPLG